MNPTRMRVMAVAALSTVAIAGLVVATWAIAPAVWRVGRIEE